MPITKRVDAALIVIVPAIVTLAMLLGGTIATLGLFALVVVVIGAYVGLRHPMFFYRALAFSLGAIPYGYLPGVHIPIPFACAVSVVLAALIHRSSVKRVTSLEATFFLLAATSLLSVVITGRSLLDFTEYAKWLLAVGVAIALLRLPRAELRKVGITYVYAAVAATAFAIFVRFVDKEGTLIKVLSPIGYGKEDNANRYVFSSTGSASVRLAGTYIDPNAAGISIFLGLVLAISLLEGRRRLIFAAIFFTGIVLTLSRSALFTVVFAVVLVFMFQQLRLRERLGIIGAFAAAFVLALSVPSVRARVFTSFGSSDTGSSARGDALAQFPGKMLGHWFFGLGWGRPEFKDPALAFTTNFVANSPLLTVYRGGVFAGIAFVIVLIAGSLMGYQCLRSRRWDLGFMGAGFIAFSVVALQLDFPVVTTSSITMTFSIFIAFVVYTWEKATDNLPVVFPRRKTLVSVPA